VTSAPIDESFESPIFARSLRIVRQKMRDANKILQSPTGTGQLLNR
jgi:hypothetical protein